MLASQITEPGTYWLHIEGLAVRWDGESFVYQDHSDHIPHESFIYFGPLELTSTHPPVPTIAPERVDELVGREFVRWVTEDDYRCDVQKYEDAIRAIKQELEGKKP